MFINKKIALAGALALVFAGSAQAAELSCTNPSVVINTSTAADWSGGTTVAPSVYGNNTAGAGGIDIDAKFDIATTLTAAQLATIEVALSGTAVDKLTSVTSSGGAIPGLGTLTLSSVGIPATAVPGLTGGTNRYIRLHLNPTGAGNPATYNGTVTVTVTCGPAATVSAVPASNPWTLAALGGVLAIAGGGAAAARRRKAQNPSA